MHFSIVHPPKNLKKEALIQIERLIKQLQKMVMNKFIAKLFYWKSVQYNLA